MLKSQSIRGGVQFYVNSKEATKQEILELSTDWKPIHEDIFRKLLKQGGETKINGVKIKVIPQETLLNSTGEKDGGMFKVPGDELRF
jgi:hypothetical protein